MKHLVDVFSLTPDSEKKRFLEDELTELSRKEKIEFYKGILQLEISPILVKETLLELDRMNYGQKKFFQAFLDSENNFVANTAREILNKNTADSNDQSARFIKLLHEGDIEDREYLIRNLMNQGGGVEIKIIQAVLRYDDPKLRKLFLTLISDQHTIDEEGLADLLKKKGIVWYTRAAIVEILGKRRSLELFRVITLLLKDVNVEVKLKLVNSLAFYPKDKVKDHLHSLCNDKFLWVRKEAKRVLSKL
jgi:hypothetical protein